MGHEMVQKDTKVITDALKLLKNGKWTTLDKLAKETPFEDGNLERFVSHLDNMGLVNFDDQNDKIKLEDMGEDVLDLPLEKES